MPREIRVRLVVGLSVMLTGLVVAFGGNLLVMLLVSHNAPSTNDINEFLAFQASMSRANITGSYLFIAGIGATILAFFSTFITWARWFVGSAEK